MNIKLNGKLKLTPIATSICAMCYWGIFIFTILISEGAAQKDLKAPAAKLISNIPFRTFSGGIVVVKLQFDDFPDSLNFIIDTGSGATSLDSATCSQMQLTPIPTDQTMMGIGGVRQVKIVKNRRLHIGGLISDSNTLNVANYEMLSSIYGEKVDGIIGNAFLARYIVNINYDSLKIRVYSKGSIKYPRYGFLLKPTLAALPVQETQIRDESVINSKVYFDTGAGLCLLLSSDFVSDSLLLDPKKKPFLTQAEGMGGKAPLQLTYVKEVKLGPYRFKKVPTYIFHDVDNITSYPLIGGLIGNDLLRRFNVTLNYGRKEIHLSPNSHFSDPFDYSYTGMSIYLINGAVQVVDVVKGSPAEKAGFKKDDIILAVEKNFTGNIQEYTTLLQNAGSKIKVIIKRASGGVAELTIKVKNIL